MAFTINDKIMISLFKVFMNPGVEIPLKEVLYSGFIGQGKKVDEFESLLKQRYDNKFILTVNSATSGLHLMLRLAKDKAMLEYPYASSIEVLTSPLTSIPTNWPILANGMRIKWVDVGMDCNMDLDDLKAKLSPSTRIILLIHWGGNPINLGKVRDIQDYCFEQWKFTPIVIQDCAHAIGSKLNDHWLSDWYPSVFSFQAIKHFTTGDGGCITFMGKEDYDKAKLLRWYGIDRESPLIAVRCMDDIKDWGYKFHMNDINATIGISQMPHADEIVGKHISNAKYYLENLDEYYKPCAPESNDYESSYWLFTMLLPDESSRLEFMKFMTDKGVMVSQVHARNDSHTCFEESLIELPNVTKFTERQVSIPVHWKLTEDDRKYIVACCNIFAKETK